MPKRRQHLHRHHVQYKDIENPRRQPDITVFIRNGIHSIVSKISRFRGMTFQEVYAIVMEALKQLRFDVEADALQKQYREMMERRKDKNE